MVELLQLGRRLGRQGYDRLRTAVEAALALGCHDAAAVRHLLATQTEALAPRRPEVALAAEDLGRLTEYDRPLPAVTAYDQLLRATAVARGAGGVR